MWRRSSLFPRLPVLVLALQSRPAVAAAGGDLDLGGVFRNLTGVIAPGFNFGVGVFLLVGLVLTGLGILHLVRAQEGGGHAMRRENVMTGIVMLISGGFLTMITTVMFIFPETLGLGGSPSDPGLDVNAGFRSR